jgi:hypothetical protein
MDIALYYIIIIGAEMGSIYYFRSGIKLLRETKKAQEGQYISKTNALLKTALGAFGILLWFVVIIISMYNQLSAGTK